jgi:hypothetical protein
MLALGLIVVGGPHEPRRCALGCVGQRSARIERDACESTEETVSGPRLNLHDEVSVERVCNHVINPPGRIRPEATLPIDASLMGPNSN